jgi:DNA-directed RNA polymerase specialized sigma24 family protein
MSHGLDAGTQGLYARLYRRLLIVVRQPDAAHRLADAAWGETPLVPTGEALDSAWLALLRQALPRALRQLRRAGRVARSPGEATPPEEVAPEGLTVPQRATWFALGGLQPQPRTALLLSLLDGMEPGKAAALLGTGPATIEAWTALARQRLRSLAPDLPVADDALRDSLAELERALPVSPDLPDPAALRRRRLFARGAWAAGLVAAAALLTLDRPHHADRPGGAPLRARRRCRRALHPQANPRMVARSGSAAAAPRLGVRCGRRVSAGVLGI